MATIGFIGSGRLGTAFGLYLAENGQQVSGYYNRTPAKARQAAGLFPYHCEAFSSMEQLAVQSDWIGITTADDAIPAVVSRLGEAGAVLEGKLIFHMSGALSSGVLHPLQLQGARIASLHPLQSFADARSGAAALKHTVFSVEGSQAAAEQLSAMLTNLRNEYFVITAEQKPLYHAAAAIASNGMTAVIDYALSLMGAAGIQEEQALSSLLPLIEGSLRNVKEKGTARGLTGPVVRGDAGTVQEHIKAMAKLAPELIPSYMELGRLTLRTALREQLTDSGRIQQMRELFEGKGSLE
ncbi:Rossmann-like and DUF2520 domain-containing protein [Aneurinibacillus tyrosinisolvens]|uniref:Rossmann-like and DUF2520 domain-containing protein n=1 Tax=Aneurinibacillus tyrosinisolvens TaxID=1443435 RepID=UPI00063F8C45|nr:Rossmann-like and DUF2520 domain-containing protein [Aneurinibacillus tyrosinisolvens]